MKFINRWLAAAAFAALMSVTAMPAQTPAKADASKTDAKSKKKAAAAPTPTASAADIAAAKASGKVWVNTESKVYHKSGKYYGATKKGKFMTEADAQKAGYRAAKS